MSWIGALFILAGFIAIMRFSKLVPKSLEVVQVSRCALDDLRNPDLDEDAKETAMQSHAKRLFGLFVVLQVGTALAILVPAGLVYILDVLTVLSFQSALEVTLSWQFLGATGAVFLLVFFVRQP